LELVVKYAVYAWLNLLKVIIFILKSDEKINKMPCKHIFHNHCVKLWLKTHKNCPSFNILNIFIDCRFDLELFFLKKNDNEKNWLKS